MSFLLDTHTLLWSLFEPKKLSKTASATLEDNTKDVLVSSVSLWEISLKYQLGKLSLKGIAPKDLISPIEKMGFVFTSISPQEASTYYLLPKLPHKDPFDRMLCWQAIQNKLILISKDDQLSDYYKHGLKVLW